MNKKDIIYTHNILKQFYKNRKLHKYEKKLIEKKAIKTLKNKLKKLNVTTSNEYISLPLFKSLLKRAYNKNISILNVLMYIDKFEYTQFENDNIFYKEKFMLLQDLKDKISRLQ